MKDFSILNSPCFFISYSLLNLVSRPITPLNRSGAIINIFYAFFDISAAFGCCLFHLFETHIVTMFSCFSSYLFGSSLFVFHDDHHSLLSHEILGFIKLVEAIFSMFSVNLPWKISPKTTTPIIIYRPNVYLQLKLLLSSKNPYI